jgi:uncharacterized protein YndB with AHSA1/START domain
MVKKVLLTIVLVVVAAIACVLALASTKPNTFHVERHATIAAPPSAVFSVVNDFHQWPKWSPWEKLDPALKRTFSGSESGVDAVYAWSGNQKAGEGKMTITESVPDSKVGIRIDFTKPMTATDKVALQFQPTDTGTEVTWSMDGDMNYVSKVMCVFMSMDKMIGKDFEAGLGNLKGVAESAPPPAADSTGGR